MPDTLFDQSIFSPLFSQLLEKRGFTSATDIHHFISSELDELEDPFKMKGMSEAVKRIHQAVEKNEKILIHGDYDVDGITGSALVARTLNHFDADSEVFLPDRKLDGYGVSLRAIEEGRARGVKLLITVDCGVTAHAQMKLAHELGLDVIIIDHHRIPAEGVPARATVINPLQESCSYPFKELSAAGLAFKLSQALTGEKALELLDLATLSTIGDVAPLVKENRIIVKHGLKTLGMRTNPGVKALAQVSKVQTRKINVGHVGFIFGPRINAAGRMSSPEIALQLLMTDHAKEAQSLAQVLNEENKERQKEERQTVKEAIQEVERTVNFSKDRVIVVGKQGWHAGVIGIVASRLVDRFNRPALVIAFDGEGGKASARSIKGFHLYNALAGAKEHLEEFGGHEQAAGFSILEKNFKAFRKKINEYANETYDDEAFVKKVRVDLEIDFKDLSAQFVRELDLLEPHGAGNPRPNFLTKSVKVKSAPAKKYQTYKFWVTQGRQTFEVSWNDRAETGIAEMLKPEMLIDLTYTVKSKSWDGIQSITLDVKDIKPQL